ncbi:MAG: AraC family transcriptional regulator, partial [Gorillibacterium sp.]|nr:AraC family transcriptional regulator [Gorillibacterium sp.]
LDQVVNSTVLKKVMNQPLGANDFMIYNDLRNEIRNMQSFDTLVEDVLLINQRQNWMIKNSGLYAFDHYTYDEQLAGLMKLPENTTWTLTPSRWFFSEENVESVSCEYSVSLVKKLPTTGLEKYGVAVANIPACSLAEFVQDDQEAATPIMILDEELRFLLHPDSSYIGKSVKESDFTKIETANSDLGEFAAQVKGAAFSVTYYRSSLNGWTYMLPTSMESLTNQSDRIGSYTLYVCLLMLILLVLLAWLGSRRMYSPIQRLLNQVGEWVTDSRKRKFNEFQVIGERFSDLFRSKTLLEKEVHQQLEQIRSFFLIKAFQGEVKPGELTDKLEQFGYEEHMRDWKTMSVLTLKLDFTEGSRYEKKDQHLLLFAVQNIIEELVPAEQRLAPVVIGYAVVLMVGNSSADSGEFQSTLYALTENLQQQLNRYLDVQASIGMSLPFYSFTNLSIAYREGLEALKHRIKLGKGIIITYGSINSGKHYLHLNYPQHSECELTDAIKLADTDKSKLLLKVLLNSIFELELSPREYQIPLNRLLNNLLIVMQESGISLNQLNQGNVSLFEELLSLNLVSDIEAWFWTRVSLPLIGIFRDRQDTQYQNISEKVIDLIHRHYDTDITLEDFASRLHYNANYLSSIFRKETNCSFSEYLTAYRFNMAKKWLLETEMPVKDMAAKLRYNNSQNFIRSFRKQEGMTPGQYRDTVRNLLNHSG